MRTSRIFMLVIAWTAAGVLSFLLGWYACQWLETPRPVSKAIQPKVREEWVTP